MPLIYLAGAIDRASVPEYGMEELLTELGQATYRHDIKGGLIFYTPALAFKGTTGRMPPEDARKMVSSNMGVLRQADALIVRYDTGQETWGVPMEVWYAFMDENMPVFVWTTLIPFNDGGSGEFSPIDVEKAENLCPTYLTAMAHEGKVYGSTGAVANAVIEWLSKSELERDVVLDPQTILRRIIGGLDG